MVLAPQPGTWSRPKVPPRSQQASNPDNSACGISGDRRRASKNAVTRLGLELIPKGMARRFVDSVERRLAGSNFKHKSRLPVELMESYGRRRAAEGITHVVFGHFHNKLVLQADGATVTVLPPWYETGEAMVVDPDSGEFTFAEI